jgi:uncharacterized membrane protein/thiol-disulfide isomerase/thioredoxin
MMSARTLTYWLAGILMMISLFLGYRPVSAQSPAGTTVPQQPAVRAVMFWTETCGHCRYVLEEVLPPLQSKYGKQLEIFLIELKSAEDFDRLYQIAALLGVYKNDVGVPFLVIGNQVLIGSGQIPAELPGLIEQYLTQGGVDIPDALRNLIPTPIQEKVIIYLFWGDGCPHCAEAKPALQGLAQSNPNVEIREYEVWYQAENQAIFTSMAAAFGFESHYVPTIFIGERYWEGYSEDILSEIETTVAACIETGCPDAGLGIAPADTSAVAAQPGTIETDLPKVPAQMQSDGFTLAIIVMVIMLATLIFAGIHLTHGLRRRPTLRRGLRRRQKPAISASLELWRNLGILALCLVGLGVAGYLAYVETRAVQAVCGPVGDCNTVQSSPYARLFGFLPVGVLGVIGYLAILAAWLYPRLRRNRIAAYMPVLVFGMALFGVLFSLYLTFLEPFVIKAVCMWCITSAVIMTLLLLLSLKPALQTLQFLQEEDRSHANIEIETPSP